MLRSGSGQSNFPPACPRRISPPVPTSTPSPTLSPDLLPDASSTAPLPAAARLLRPLAGPVRRSPPPANPGSSAAACAAPPHTAAKVTALTPRAQLCSTACVSSAPRCSMPWLATGSWCASAPALACADAPAVAAHPALPDSAPRSARKAILAQQVQQSAPRPRRSVFCFRTTLARILAAHRPTTVRCPTPPANARTTDSARKPPSLPALPWPASRTVKLLRFRPVLQPLLRYLSG